MDDMRLVATTAAASMNMFLMVRCWRCFFDTHDALAESGP
jgi:hypothetical protein